LLRLAEEPLDNAGVIRWPGANAQQQDALFHTGHPGAGLLAHLHGLQHTHQRHPPLRPALQTAALAERPAAQALCGRPPAALSTQTPPTAHQWPTGGASQLPGAVPAGGGSGQPSGPIRPLAAVLAARPTGHGTGRGPSRHRLRGTAAGGAGLYESRGRTHPGQLLGAAERQCAAQERLPGVTAAR